MQEKLRATIGKRNIEKRKGKNFMLRKITSFCMLLALLCSLGIAKAESVTQTIDPWICVVHDDGNPATITSTAIDGQISRGSVGYIRRQIVVLDLSQIEIPEGMALDEAVYSLYCITNYEIVDSEVGIYALDVSDIDFSQSSLTNDNVPTEGDLITTFFMPARVNGEKYNAYIDFDLSAYLKKAIANGEQYVGFCVLQTTKSDKGGLAFGTKYHGNPPKLTLSFRERGVVAQSYSVVGEAEASAQLVTVTSDPWINVCHDDGNAARFTSTDATQQISLGSVGYIRQMITVIDLSKLNISEETALENLTFTFYATATYEAADTTIGVYEMDTSGITADGLAYADVPARGDIITTINMPAKGTVDLPYRIDVDLTEYVQTALAAGKQYVAFSMIQTSRCYKGGIGYATQYHANAPKLTVSYWKQSEAFEEKNVLCAGELEYSVTLLNETDEAKQVRLVWAEVSGNRCVNVVVSDPVLLAGNEEMTLSLKQEVSDTDNMARFFVVEDTGTLIRPLVDEKYELTKNGWE